MTLSMEPYLMRIISAFVITAALLTQGFAQAADWQINVSGHGIARGQAPDPANAEYAFPLKQQLLLDDQGRYRSERWSTFPGDITFHFLEVGGPQGLKSVDLAGWRTGTETEIDGPESASISYADMLLLSPVLLLKLARETSAVDENGGQTLVDPAGRTLQLQRDATGEVSALIKGEQQYLYTQWAGEGELRQPRQIKVMRGDRQLREYTDVTLQAAAAKPADFQIPAGYADAYPRNGLRIVKVEGDLYRLEGSPSTYHMAFAVGSEGIVLFDTPRGKEEGEAMRREITAAFPGRPVTDIVYSHGHSDHQAGLSAWLDLQPQIWTGVGGRTALMRNVAGADQIQIIEVGEARDLLRGNLALRLLPVRTGHAQDMLVTLFPASRAVLQGDMFMVPNQGPVAAYPLAEHLQQVLRDARFEADHIISVHGRVATADELATSVNLQHALAQESQKQMKSE